MESFTSLALSKRIANKEKLINFYRNQLANAVDNGLSDKQIVAAARLYIEATEWKVLLLAKLAQVEAASV